MIWTSLLGRRERRQIEAGSCSGTGKRREASWRRRKTAETQKPAYTIVPYQGAHGTRRRPIYLECQADRIILQPEGIVFGERDFAGPLDSGNPLDVALRAVREYLTEQQGRIGNGSPEEPYPLLLVRPSGISAYYAARAAMQSWGAEFGYELIGEDWDLEYFPADSALARAVAAAVEPARRRQRAALAAAPSHYGGGAASRPVYSVQPYRGGVVRRDMDGGTAAGAGCQRAGQASARVQAGRIGRNGTTLSERRPAAGATGKASGRDDKGPAASSVARNVGRPKAAEPGRPARPGGDCPTRPAARSRSPGRFASSVLRIGCCWFRRKAWPTRRSYRSAKNWRRRLTRSSPRSGTTWTPGARRGGECTGDRSLMFTPAWVARPALTNWNR